MRAVLSFLTRLPLGHGDIRKAAEDQHLFPLAGALIGCVASLVGYTAMLCLPIEIAVVFTILSIYALVGLLHLDGLADFSDGVMTSGDRNRKIAAMKDPHTGIAGVFAVVFILILTFFCMRELAVANADRTLLGHDVPMDWPFSFIILSEISAKISMNTCIFLGKETHEGMGSLFIRHSSPAKYATAFSLALIISLLVAVLYFWVVLVGVLTGIVIVSIANRNFGGISGDALGAANEIARVATLLVLVVII